LKILTVFQPKNAKVGGMISAKGVIMKNAPV